MLKMSKIWINADTPEEKQICGRFDELIDAGYSATKTGKIIEREIDWTFGGFEL